MDDLFKERAAALALNTAFGFEPKISRSLIGQLGTAASVFDISEKDLDELFGPYSKHRALVGSAALEDPAFLSRTVDLWGDRIAVGIDARDGFVQTKGWVETTRVKAVDLAAAVAKTGVKTIIYTDTATDGMLGGPNLAQMVAICDAAPTCQITASGGISSTYDIQNLKALERSNLRAAIVGKALYDGRATLREMNLAAL